MRVALETNRYVDLCKGVEEPVRIVATAEAVFLPYMWVSALVLQHNLVLHDRDRHFDHLPQIVRV